MFGVFCLNSEPLNNEKLTYEVLAFVSLMHPAGVIIKEEQGRLTFNPLHSLFSRGLFLPEKNRSILVKKGSIWNIVI